MKAQEMRQFAQQYVDALNSGDPDKIESFFAPGAVSVSVRGKEQQMDRAARREYHTDYRRAFPDAHMTIEDTTVDADKGSIAFQWKVVGTHKGGFMGMGPTNKKLEIRGNSVLEVQNGKITKETSYSDTAALMRQLGMKAPSAPAGPEARKP
jgi:steroid delta-isomerase-like uncharacterized protein